MKQGYLSQYFKGVAVKTLSAVEADMSISNQHEYNVTKPLKKIFGLHERKFAARFAYLSDIDEEALTDDGSLTLYDSRKNQPHRSPEFRMYFTATTVSFSATAGDELFIALKPDDTVLVIVAAGGSTIASQLRWLFGLCDAGHMEFSVRDVLESEQDRISFATRFVLEQIGIIVSVQDNTHLEDMLRIFGRNFPKTKEFSKYARSTLADISPTDNPDAVLMAWMDREEILFRAMEKHLIADYLGERLKEGFDGDVEHLANFFLSIQNRRKSRVGHALENHVEEILLCQGIQFDRGKITENKSRPDFIFPGIQQYHDSAFDITLLTMLGVKSTCKDRWRQVLSEADKIQNKHLLTLEAAISENQTNEMRSQKMQLVVPAAIQGSYTESQRKWLICIKDFIRLVQARQTD